MFHAHDDALDHNNAHTNDLRANHVNVTTPACGKLKPALLRESVYCKTLAGLTPPHRTPEVCAIRTLGSARRGNRFSGILREPKSL
jgi:hypothetical protein